MRNSNNKVPGRCRNSADTLKLDVCIQYKDNMQNSGGGFFEAMMANYLAFLPVMLFTLLPMWAAKNWMH